MTFADGCSTIGLLPAAGHARRIAPLPYSKELLPLWVPKGGERPRAVCEQALARMQAAGMERALVVLRPGKWDIPAHLGSGRPEGPALGYLVTTLPHGVPFTLDAAYPFVRGHRIALGLPDILFDDDDAYVRLLERHDRDGSDVLLGSFPADRPRTMDLIELDETRVRRILIKPRATRLRLTWGIAVWRPSFTEFMHEHVARLLRGEIQHEIHLGEVFQAAIDAGLRVAALRISKRPFLDIGNPEGLRLAYRRLARVSPPR